MYAVIRTGGKQYRVRTGDVVEVEHLSVKGTEAVFTPVLVVTDDGRTIYGKEQLDEYPVTARLLGDAKGDKVTVLKYRPKTGYAARRGHRQLYSLIEITSIGAAAAPQASAPKAPEDRAEKGEGPGPKARAPKPAEGKPAESKGAGGKAATRKAGKAEAE